MTTYGIDLTTNSGKGSEWDAGIPILTSDEPLGDSIEGRLGISGM
jgi:hypothetical protein